jgi:hypothetical protein
VQAVSDGWPTQYMGGAIGGAPLQFRAAWSTGIQTVSKYFKIKLIQKGFCVAQKIRKKIQF